MNLKKGKIDFIEIPELFNIRLVKGRDICHDFKTHLHRTCNIGLITNGKVNLTVKDQKFMLEEEQLFIIPPKTPHSLTVYKDINYSHFVLCFKVEILKNYIQDFNGNWLGFNQVRIVDGKLYREFADAFEMIADDNSLIREKEDYLKKLLEKLWSFEIKGVEENNGIGDDKILLIKKSKEYMDSKWQKDLSLNELSNGVGMSKFYFSRVFKKVVGLSPYDYLLQLKIKKAQILLEEAQNIVWTVHETGFYDQSHFSRYFKKFVGVSPSEYINNYRRT